MQGIISRVLCLLPARVTGRLSAKAEQLVKPAYAHRETVEAHKFGPVGRILFWGNLHPVLFSLLIGELLFLIAAIAGGHWLKGESLLVAPSLSFTFDYSAFIAVPWAVQATLLALVYPLVISFVAIMMQRKANSRIALRAYLVDSGVVPAGASSVALTLALTTQYVMSVYDYSTYAVAVLVFNWGWLALNLLLTGNFLARTIGFLNEEESQLAFKRLALNVTLWAEWVEVVTRNLYREAPSTVWSHITVDGKTSVISTMFWKRAKNPVTRVISGSQKLVDIHTGLFSLAIWAWRRRAAKGFQAGLYKKPELVLAAQVGSAYTGRVELCGVEVGPRMSWFEQYLLGCSFVFESKHAKAEPPSSGEMVEELVMEVEALAEARKFREAKAAMDRTKDFHLALLKSVQEPSRVSLNDTSVEFNTVSTGWVEPYYGLGRLAVSQIAMDRSLLRAVAYFPGGVSLSLSVLDEIRIVEAMRVASHLVVQLEAWWVQQVDAAGLEKGNLPQGSSKLYDRALLDVIGAWNTYRVYIPRTADANEAKYWGMLCSRARIYCTHLERTVEWLLGAIARGDETASARFGDLFLKWWGTRTTELMPPVEGGQRLFDVGLSVIDLSWDDAQDKYYDERYPLNSGRAARLVGAAIKDYWEALRLLLALVLLEKCSHLATEDSLEVRMLKHLLLKKAFKDGGEVKGNDWASRDSIWTAYLTISFRDKETSRRVNAFIEQQRWDRQVPEVPGWTYLWSGSSLDIETRFLQLALLASVFDGDTPTPPSAKRVIEGLWRDTETLQYVASVMSRVGDAFATNHYAAGLQKVVVLRKALSFTGYSVQVRHSAKHQALALAKVAKHERQLTLRCRSVDTKLLPEIGRFIGKKAFERVGVAAQPFKRVQVLQNLGASKQTLRLPYEKEALQRLQPGFDRDHNLSSFADHVWESARVGAVAAYLKNRDIPTYALDALTRTDAPLEAPVTAVLRNLVADADKLKAAGDSPVVISSNTSFFDSPYGWTDALYGKAPPSDIRIERAATPGTNSIYLQINETPILNFDGMGKQCCVVPQSIFDVLYVEGAGLDSALKVALAPFNDELVFLEASFSVGLLEELRK